MERFFFFFLIRNDPLKMEVRKGENVLVNVNISWGNKIKGTSVNNISAILSLVISDKKSCLFHMKTDQ